MQVNAQSVELEWNVPISMRDGVRLNCTLYLPRSLPAPAPSILLLTPYVTDTYHERGMYFAAHGLPFAIVDSRGRGESDGTFKPYALNEAQDGYDAVEWLASQPYCNGQVGMWGGSYNGMVQWTTAKERPPHLATIVPVASPHLGTDVPMRCNILQSYMVQWLGLVNGRAYHHEKFADNTWWSSIYRRWYELGRPLCELDGIAGMPSEAFQEWLAHPEPDAYWDTRNPTAAEYGQMDIPILTITGSYDDDQPGALAHYREHIRHAFPEARSKHFLIIGPWDHFGTRTPKAKFGGLEFNADSLVDLPKLHAEWYAWTMQGGTKPAFLKKRVTYYVMGAERWRYADTLEDVTSHHQDLYLDSALNASDVFSSGTLGANRGAGQPDAYTYDPGDDRKPEWDAEASSDPASFVDQSVLLALQGKALVYHSAPFKEATEISGFFELSAWISIDCPDTDIYVSVHEIGLDGRSIQLTTDAVRARYREGLRRPRLITTQEPLRYDFKSFTFVSREISAGHRLRLVVAPMGRLIQAAFTERNFNSGGVVARESVTDARAVCVRLFHDLDHPSVLRAPIGRAASSDEPGAPVGDYRTSAANLQRP